MKRQNENQNECWKKYEKETADKNEDVLRKMVNSNKNMYKITQESVRIIFPMMITWC